MNYKIAKKLTHDELAKKFIEINTEVRVVSWIPLIADDSREYADSNQPTIRVELDNGNWLRVYVDKKNKEITWY